MYQQGRMVSCGVSFFEGYRLGDLLLGYAVAEVQVFATYTMLMFLPNMLYSAICSSLCYAMLVCLRDLYTVYNLSNSSPLAKPSILTFQIS